ncbi:MAG: ribosome biogenesis GTP-binding protein YihA/YsxC [Betaproteobacteria bacterium]|nr:ribosome biogenesis GTP-binding protein YihA/YsxC [Betaproteobacteria bacterium]
MNPFSELAFVTSVASPDQLPPPDAVEVAFSGRSNVGKSSAINAIAHRKRLAFVSKTPGRTQTINFFRSEDGTRLVDLPGYGFARVPQAMRASWEALMVGYLADRSCLCAIVLVMDSRHPLTPNDLQLLDWLRPELSRGKRLLVLLSKSDKLSRLEGIAVRRSVTELLSRRAIVGEVRLFSSLNGEGVDEARGLLEKWLLDAGLPASSIRNKEPPAKGRQAGGESALIGIKAARSGRRSGRRTNVRR